MRNTSSSREGNSKIPQPPNKVVRKLGRHARLGMALALILADLVSLLLAFSLAILIRIEVLGKIQVGRYYSLWPILFIFIVAFALRGLYLAVGLSSVNELRLSTSTISVVFLLLILGTYWIHESEVYSRLVLTFAWLLAMVLVQVDRWVLRVVGREFWGEPVIVVGNGPNTEHIVSYLLRNNHLGMYPEMVLQGKMPPSQEVCAGLKARNINTALLVSDEVSDETRDFIINDNKYGFWRVILISNLGWVGSLGVVAHDLEGILGMEVRQNLLNFWQRGLKRGIDLIFGTLILILVSPLLLVISAIIGLEGPGGVFYRQHRVGQNGQDFLMWKFRTMVPEADQKLEFHLKTDARLDDEWRTNQKLKNDPRLTRIGKVIRRWSLDEFPQLVNVIRGEMSLVGPRPFFSEQVHYYGNILNLYYRVRPGITGMWQVSGRNNTTFIDRVRMDEYYVRNWSIWLDIYLMLRTIWVVLSGKGAY